ncbi:MAG: hypothetical protein RMZ41_012225 [Nostoc sp. DedVER02]|uniref:hypothetical protein n=1 Tax=unclassified Nostoc TaxID=2593658 RepID=UPI002AD4AA67|nr:MULTISPECIES: hypothetical protein [unclassified Nostoc]MDZ7984997.1 hypothetical protein [Nostoc sp. DedVER02]MDZ8114115.1 hypothetical protein [Nostoc sp. DedVER01b]
MNFSACPKNLCDCQVNPLSVGRVIVATWHPHETTVFETIRQMGLELQVITNKAAVMILPSGINKATGLAAALDGMQVSPQNVVGMMQKTIVISSVFVVIQ